MAELAYTLTYAGVPFISDRADSAAHQVPQPEAKIPIERWQPKKEFYDELCSLVPLESLREFYPPQPYQGRNLNALDGEDRQFDRGEVGRWYYPTGACRWSVFHGLATGSMVKEMVRLTNGGDNPATFIMKAVPTLPSGLPDSSYTVQTSMYMLPPRTISENFGGEGIFLITLVDERYYWQGSAVTIHPTISTTWADLLTSLASALSISSLTYSTIETVYGKPEPDSQLWVNKESASFLLDNVARNLGRVVVRNLDGSVSLKTWAESQAQMVSNRGSSLRVIRCGGGDFFTSGSKLSAGSLLKTRNSIVPERIFITFPYYVNGDDPVPHYLNSRYTPNRPTCWYEQSYGNVYTVTVPLASGGPNVSGLNGDGDQFVHTTAKALISGELQTTPLNTSGLNALAMQIARNQYDAQVVPTLDETYPGTLVWTPEGCNDIHWTYSERLRTASCRVVRAEWNMGLREAQYGTPLPVSGTFSVSGVRGIGGPSVAQTVRDNQGNAVYGVNLVTFNGPTVSGSFTSGGISEAIITAIGGGGGTFNSGAVVNFNNATVNFQAGTVVNNQSGTVVNNYQTTNNYYSGSSLSIYDSTLDLYAGAQINQRGNVSLNTLSGTFNWNSPNLNFNSGSISYSSGVRVNYNVIVLTYGSGARITYSSGSKVQSGSTVTWDGSYIDFCGGTWTNWCSGGKISTTRGIVTHDLVTLTISSGITTATGGSIILNVPDITIASGSVKSGSQITYDFFTAVYSQPSISTTGGNLNTDQAITRIRGSGPGQPGDQGPGSITLQSGARINVFDQGFIALQSGTSLYDQGGTIALQSGGQITVSDLGGAITLQSGTSLTLASGAILNLNGQNTGGFSYTTTYFSGSTDKGSGVDNIVVAYSGTGVIRGIVTARNRAGGLANLMGLAEVHTLLGSCSGSTPVYTTPLSGEIMGTLSFGAGTNPFNLENSVGSGPPPPYSNIRLMLYSASSGTTVDYDGYYSLAGGA